jgi:hypothetical protein
MRLERRLALKRRRPDIWSRDRDHFWYRDDTILTNGPVEVGRLRAALRMLLKLGAASPSKKTRGAVDQWATHNELLVYRAHGHPFRNPKTTKKAGKR